MSVALALDGFIKVDIVWESKLRKLDGDGIFADLPPEITKLKGMVVERQLKNLQLDNKGSIGVDELDVFFKGKVPLCPSGKIIAINDVFKMMGEDFTVRQVRYRPEGGFTKAVTKLITRRELDA